MRAAEGIDKWFAAYAFDRKEGIRMWLRFRLKEAFHRFSLPVPLAIEHQTLRDTVLTGVSP
jgi:hypothetical protein